MITQEKYIVLNSKIEVGGTYPTNENGDIIVISKLKKPKYYLIKFLDTGNTKEIRIDGIKDGIVKDLMRPSRFGVGYMGLGTYASVDNKGKALQCVVMWKSMLERCYCPKFQVKSPTYKGCTVIDAWHNYQIFAKWFYANYPRGIDENYQLDKDFVVKGNTVYSPDTCTFLSQADNKRIAHEKSYRFVNPEGEIVDIVNMERYCKDKDLTSRNMGKVHRGERPHHKGWTKYHE